MSDSHRSELRDVYEKRDDGDFSFQIDINMMPERPQAKPDGQWS